MQRNTPPTTRTDGAGAPGLTLRQRCEPKTTVGGAFHRRRYGARWQRAEHISCQPERPLDGTFDAYLPALARDVGYAKVTAHEEARRLRILLVQRLQRCLGVVRLFGN